MELKRAETNGIGSATILRVRLWLPLPRVRMGTRRRRPGRVSGLRPLPPGPTQRLRTRSYGISGQAARGFRYANRAQSILNPISKNLTSARNPQPPSALQPPSPEKLEHDFPTPLNEESSVFSMKRRVLTVRTEPAGNRLPNAIRLPPPPQVHHQKGTGQQPKRQHSLPVPHSPPGGT